MDIKIFESSMELLVLKIKSKCLFFTGYSSEPIVGNGYNGSKQTLAFTGLPGNDKEELTIDLTVRNSRISLITNSDLEDFDRLVFNVSFIRDSSVEEFTTGRGRFVIQEVELYEGKRFGKKKKSEARWWEILEVPETDAEWFNRYRDRISRLRADSPLEAIEGLYNLKPLMDEIEAIGDKLRNEK